LRLLINYTNIILCVHLFQESEYFGRIVIRRLIFIFYVFYYPEMRVLLYLR